MFVIAEKILDLFFPRKCIFCGRIMWKEEGCVCRNCVRDLPYTFGNAAVSKGEFFSKCVSPFYYKDNVRDSIRRFKFADRSSYAEEYAPYLADCINIFLDGKYDVMTWVPVSAKRLKKRGYDQAELLVKAMEDRLGIKGISVLVKVKDTPAQSSLKGAARRRANISGAYKVRNEKAVAGKRVLLIDDVVTTGSTLSECSRMLLMAGAESVVCAAFAKAE